MFYKIDVIIFFNKNFWKLSAYTGRFCNSDQDCFDVDRATCSDDHKCICRENSFARIDNDVCLSLIAGYCTKDSDCVPLNSVCTNNYCTCDYMYTPLSNRECKLCKFNFHLRFLVRIGKQRF